MTEFSKVLISETDRVFQAACQDVRDFQYILPDSGSWFYCKKQGKITTRETEQQLMSRGQRSECVYWMGTGLDFNKCDHNCRSETNAYTQPRRRNVLMSTTTAESGPEGRGRGWFPPDRRIFLRSYFRQFVSPRVWKVCELTARVASFCLRAHSWTHTLIPRSIIKRQKCHSLLSRLQALLQNIFTKPKDITVQNTPPTDKHKAVPPNPSFPWPP